MSKSPVRQRLSNVAIALLVLAFVLALADRAGSPTVDTLGEIQSVGFVLADTPPRRVASIKLATGELVQAKIDPDMAVKPGATVRVHVSKRIISGTKSYDVIRSESAK